MTRIRNVKNTTKFKRSIKAISPVIATLLMIAIAVVASLVAYAWVMGYMSFTTNNSGKALALPSFSIDDAQDLHVYVQNVGQGSVIISDIYVNDIGQTFTPDPNFPTNELAYGETADLVVPGTFEDDVKLNIKVTAGDGTFMTATGKPGSGGSSNQVGKTDPTVVVSCSPNPVTVNTASTVTVTVTGTGGVTPTGTLTVAGGTGSYGTVSGPTGTGNTATYTVTFTPSTTTGSPFTITANYPGDTHYNSASDTDSLAVSAAKTTPTVVVSCSPNPVTVNTASTVTVTVTGTGGVTPTGTLTVAGGTGSYGTVSGPTGTGNTATYTVTFTPSTTTGSPFTITANYPGDTHYNSASDTDSLTVNPAPAGIQRVQGIRGTSSNDNAISATLTHTPTSGNKLVAVIGTYRTGGSNARVVNSITQTGVTWTRVTGITNNDGNDARNVEIWLGTVGSGAIRTLSISLSDDAAGAVVDVCEYSGLVAASTVDKTATTNGQTYSEWWGSSASTSTGTTTNTAQNSELWIGGITVQGNIAQTSPTNSFTNRDGASTGAMSLSYLEKIVSATGTANSGTTADTNDRYYVGCIATFKGA